MRQLRKGYAITVPEYSSAMSTWYGASYVLQQWNYTADQPFSLVDFFGVQASETCVLCIRWRQGVNVYRYKLWGDVGEFMPTVDLYAGQVIRENFSIELWSVDSDEAEITLTELSLKTSATVIGSCCSVQTAITFLNDTSTAWLSNP